MKKILTILSFLLTSMFVEVSAFADDYQFHLLDAEKLEIKYTKFNPDSRDPYAPEYTGRWRERASLLWRVSVLDRLYWDNDVHAETIDTGVVKTVGWHYTVGLRTFSFLDFVWEHHSRHILDEPSQINSFETQNQFPVENSYGIVVRFIEEKHK